MTLLRRALLRATVAAVVTMVATVAFIGFTQPWLIHYMLY